MTIRSFFIATAAAAIVATAAAAATTSKTPSFHVEITGHGKPMILIPGFASSGKTWDGTVAHFKDRYECHVLTLAGFAGEPRIDAPFLETVRNDLASYIREHNLTKPVIVGHSLGGVLALWLAEKEPDLPASLIIVDSLPFLAGVMDPAATADSVKAQAAQMRKMYNGPATAQSDKMGEMAVKAMVTSPTDFEMIMGWTRKSDRIAMGDALYEMMTTDLRPDLDKIACPTLVLGTWIAYKQYATRDQVEQNFRLQYKKLAHYDFVLSENARHFVMLDDPDGFYRALDHFLKH
jgi:pimeloyl-ACP methyl ester carboxylesterase